jgi:hypothetical protein
LPEFASSTAGLDYNVQSEEIYLYHGTNCYRRWEINHTGAIEPGRNNYSFFCTNPNDAYSYARAACVRDINPENANSLTCEPVVLKVRFNSRLWLQVDFVQQLNRNDSKVDDKKGYTSAPISYSIAVLGPVLSPNIIEVLHCTHGRRLNPADSVRTFEDGTFLNGIKHLRTTLMRRRADAWLIKQMGILTRKVGTTLKGGEVPALTLEDDLKRLRQRIS